MQPIHDVPVLTLGPAVRHGAVVRACAYLESHPGRPIPLDELARASYSSKYHLHRTFRQNMGVTPAKYHLTLRLGRARELLAAGVPPSHVAYETGFADQAHLTRLFKETFGMPPGRYTAAATHGTAFGAPVLVPGCGPAPAAPGSPSAILAEVA